MYDKNVVFCIWTVFYMNEKVLEDPLIRAIVFKMRKFVNLTPKNIYKNHSTLLHQNSNKNSRVARNIMCLKNRFSYACHLHESVYQFYEQQNAFRWIPVLFLLVRLVSVSWYEGKNRENRRWSVLANALNVKLIVERARFVIWRLFLHPLLSSATGNHIYYITNNIIHNM